MLKLLLIVILLYLVLRTARNLVRAVLADGGPPPPRMEPPPGYAYPTAREREAPPGAWQSARPTRHPRPDDIEDAKWRDV